MFGIVLYLIVQIKIKKWIAVKKKDVPRNEELSQDKELS